MAINKGTIKQKTSNGTEILYPITSVDQIQDLSTAVMDLTSNQTVNGQKDFTTIPRAYTPATGPKIIPDTYEQLQYITTNTYAYIDTGLKRTNEDFTIEMDMVPVRTTGGSRTALCGADWNYSSYMVLNPNTMHFDIQDTRYVDYTATYGIRYTVATTFFSDHITMTLYDSGGILLGTVTRPTMSWTTSVQATFIVGGIRNQASDATLTQNIYRAKITIGSTLMRDFIPARRLSDNKVGMYDIVNDVFYTNAGTDNLLPGPSTEAHYEALLTDAILPKNVSELTNDVGYITTNYHDNTKANQSALNEVTAKIPSAASNSNQLADKEFVNSSIGTATSEFRGTYTTLETLQAASGDLNDYAFYNHTDSAGNTVFDRYKYTSGTPHWVYEYSLNNSSFTADQWAAINSGITQGDWVDMTNAQVISGQKDFNITPRVKVTHETHNLPDAYQEVEYLESSGTQFLDSGYIPNANSKVIFDSILGVRSISSDIRQGRHGDGQRLSIAIVSGNKLEFAIGGYLATSLNVVGQRHLYELDVPNLTGKMDGITQATFSSVSWTNQQTLYFFARHMSSGQDGLGNVRNYNIKIYEQDILIRHFIPCYRKSDDEPGMYDVINNIFYTNIGSGVFNIGSELYPVTYENLLTDASFATVATSGSYNDLINKPTIPTVNNATLTIQKNGTTVNTFTANASSNVIANITVPTATSDLTNNAGFITSSYHDSTKEDISNKITTISNSSTDTQYPSAKCVYDNIEDVREVAEGKSTNYVINSKSEITGTEDSTTHNYSNVSAITGIDISRLKIGDNIYIKDMNTPDYWVSRIYTDTTSITNLTSTTWLFDVSPNTTSRQLSVNIKLTDDRTYEYIAIEPTSNGIINYRGPGFLNVFINGSWNDESYRTITITGGSKVQDIETINYFKNNAILVSGNLVVDLSKLETVKPNIASISVNGTNIQPVLENVNIDLTSYATKTELLEPQYSRGEIIAESNTTNLYVPAAGYVSFTQNLTGRVNINYDNLNAGEFSDDSTYSGNNPKYPPVGVERSAYWNSASGTPLNVYIKFATACKPHDLVLKTSSGYTISSCTLTLIQADGTEISQSLAISAGTKQNFEINPDFIEVVGAKINFIPTTWVGLLLVEFSTTQNGFVWYSPETASFTEDLFNRNRSYVRGETNSMIVKSGSAAIDNPSYLLGFAGTNRGNIMLVNPQTFVNNILQSISGYDATKTQTLKNINGTFTWVDD